MKSEFYGTQRFIIVFAAILRSKSRRLGFVTFCCLSLCQREEVLDHVEPTRWNTASCLQSAIAYRHPHPAEHHGDPCRDESS
jgi:hypothetical protein